MKQMKLAIATTILISIIILIKTTSPGYVALLFIKFVGITCCIYTLGLIISTAIEKD